LEALIKDEEGENQGKKTGQIYAEDSISMDVLRFFSEQAGNI